MSQLSFDEDGRVYGLEDVDFEIPYPSKDQDDQRKFQEQVEALAKHAEDEPNRPIYMASRLPKELDQTGFAICYREVGLIVGFQKPPLPTPILYGTRQLPMRPRPMTLRIEFSDQYMKSYVGKALDENCGFEVKYEEGMPLPEVPDRLVLVPIPAVPAPGPPGRSELLEDALKIVRAYPGGEEFEPEEVTFAEMLTAFEDKYGPELPEQEDP